MQAFFIDLEHFEPLRLMIVPTNHYFKIMHHDVMILALKQVGTTWEIVAVEEILPEDLAQLELVKKLAAHQEEITLTTPQINQVIGAIENRIW